MSRLPHLPRLRLPRLPRRRRERAQRGMRTARRSGILRAPRRAALAAIGALVAGASLVSFAESYRGLYLWAHHHGLSGVWAAGWPLQVDAFIGVGELALFVALVDGWEHRSRTGAWLVTLSGLAVSVAGNIGHVAGHAFLVRATAAVPPLAAASALAVGLGVLKRVVRAYDASAGSAVPASAPVAAPEPAAGPDPVPDPHPGIWRSMAANEHGPGWDDAVPEALNGHAHRAAEMFAAELAAGQVPGIRAIRSGLHVGQPRASEVQAYLRTLART